MAGNKMIISRKISGSSIIEALISMIIIIIVFGIAMMIYTNIVRLSLSVKKIQTEALLNNMMLNVENAGKLTKVEYSSTDVRVEQLVTPAANIKGLLLIHLTAYDTNNKKIAELQKLIIKNGL